VRDERGQLTVAAVGVMVALLLGATVLVHLAQIRAAGGHAQRAADLASIAAAQLLAARPDADPAQLRRAAGRAASANGARLESLRLEHRGSVPTAVDVQVALVVRGSVPVVGERADRLPARSRAGVSFTATLDPHSFRPVDLRGATGRAGVVAAAEGQIGWPYVWGGESRAEGGFDCSGLVDYAYAQAGVPLPGRPTAAELWQLSQPIAAAELQPGDLVFMGSAGGAPYHVGLYAGGGEVVVAPHTGAQVGFEPLAGGGWDGFGRLLPAAPGAQQPPTAVEQAAVAHQVPANVLAAELELGVASDPQQAAAALQAAQRRHPGDLVGALSEALGDRSAAALVVRAATGLRTAIGFLAGAVRLLPTPSPDGGGPAGSVGGVPDYPQPGTPVSGSGGGWWSSFGQAGDAAVGGAGRLARMVETGEGRLTLGGLAGLKHISRLGLNALTLIPNRTVSAAASATGAVWDVSSGVTELARTGIQSGFVTSGPGLWASRLTLGGAVLTAFVGGLMLLTGRTRRQRVLGGLQAAGGVIQVAGFATAGTDLLAAGAVSMEVPPVGAVLIVTGTVIMAGVVLYQSWPALSAAGATAARWAGRQAARVGDRAGAAASAVADGARSLVSSLPTPW
jgi:cell wall-associated NlpC family hydrolase